MKTRAFFCQCQSTSQGGEVTAYNIRSTLLMRHSPPPSPPPPRCARTISFVMKPVPPTPKWITDSWSVNSTRSERWQGSLALIKTSQLLKDHRLDPPPPPPWRQPKASLRNTPNCEITQSRSCKLNASDAGRAGASAARQQERQILRHPGDVASLPSSNLQFKREQISRSSLSPTFPPFCSQSRPLILNS